MKDKDIDFSEIPELTRAQLAGAKMRAGLRPIPRGKTRVSMFLDNAIVEYFKTIAGGRGYQTVINKTLGEHIRSHDLEGMLRRLIREEMRRAKR